MKPFPPVIYSLFETLSGCNYINSHARFTWAIDHKLYFRSETDNRFRIENLVGWVCMRIILKEKKKKKPWSPSAIQSQPSHLLGLVFDENIWREFEAGSEVTQEGGEMEPSRAKKGGWDSGGGQASAPVGQSDLEPTALLLWPSVSTTCKTRDDFISTIPSFQLLKLYFFKKAKDEGR